MTTSKYISKTSDSYSTPLDPRRHCSISSGVATPGRGLRNVRVAPALYSADTLLYFLRPCFAIKLLDSPQSQMCGPASPSFRPCSLIMFSICLARPRLALSVVRLSAQPYRKMDLLRCPSSAATAVAAAGRPSVIVSTLMDLTVMGRAKPSGNW
jgi:hypothetical protein